MTRRRLWFAFGSIILVITILSFQNCGKKSQQVSTSTNPSSHLSPAPSAGSVMTRVYFASSGAMATDKCIEIQSPYLVMADCSSSLSQRFDLDPVPEHPEKFFIRTAEDHSLCVYDQMTVGAWFKIETCQNTPAFQFSKIDSLSDSLIKSEGSGNHFYINADPELHIISYPGVSSPFRVWVVIP